MFRSTTLSATQSHGQPIRWLLSMLAVLALLATHLFVSASPAPAATGSVYDGKDPSYNSCVSGSYAIYAKDLYKSNHYMGTVQVMYSPRCGTNWVRTYQPYSGSDGGNCVASYKRIERPKQGNLTKFVETENDLDCKGGPPIGWTYSMMVYAPGNTSIKVNVTLDSSVWSVQHSVTLV